MTACYVFDPAQSRFTVQVFVAGWLSAFGHSPTFAVRNFRGELRFDPDAPATATLWFSARAYSLDLLDKVKLQDRAEIERRMRQEVLETTTYPEITFRTLEIKANKVADGWYRPRLAGDLDLHGVKRPQPFDVQLRLSGDQVRLSGRCSLSQSAYRIKPVTALGGAIKLEDEVAIEFALLGRGDAT